MWTALISPLLSLGKQWLSNKAEEKQAVHAAKLRRIEQEADWEAIQAQGSLNSFKDEYWTIVLSLPILALMYGVAFGDVTVIDRIKETFKILEELPEYYQYMLYVAVLASFGIRGADKLMEMRK